ncbi:hypothetical protein SRABI84_02051 [Peribacillus simplex]|nr:hypothetical protein SRABI84_02051 [Peribacillus simplex]
MKKFSIAAICIIVILVVMYGFTGNYFYNIALNPNKEKDFLSDNPHLAQSEAVSGEVLNPENWRMRNLPKSINRMR